MMSHRREYQIAFVGLKPGIHTFNYEITDKFFQEYQEQDFKNCKAKIALKLEKNASFMQLTFEIGGSLETYCDRCGNEITLDLWDEFSITVKVVAEPELMNDEENDPDVFYIGKYESHVDISNWIYEFINLSIPMQKHCGLSTGENKICNPNALAFLTTINQAEQTTNEEVVNPIWKGLEKFKKE